MKKSFVSTLVVMFFMVSCCVSNTKPTYERVNAEISNIYRASASVSKEDGDTIGSGTVLRYSKGKTLLVITAAHVVKEKIKYFINLPFNKKTIAVNVKKFNTIMDLALVESVEVMGEDGPFVKVSNYSSIGDKVWVIGCPMGDKFVVSSGNISDIVLNKNKVELIRITAPVFFGNSGGGVFLNGKLIGVISSLQMIIAGSSIIIVPGASFSVSYVEIIKFLK